VAHQHGWVVSDNVTAATLMVRRKEK
jgi:hypothetical protein